MHGCEKLGKNRFFLDYPLNINNGNLKKPPKYKI
jgi:hypothetical protein